MATIFWVSASRIRVEICARPERGPRWKLPMFGCVFFSLKTWMLLTWSSAVIGLATLTVIGTVLPFSTSGGTSSLTLPVRTTAPPTTLRIAAASIAGVASAGLSVTAGTAPSTAAPPARPRNCRRVEWSCPCIPYKTLLFAQGCKIGHHILDLFRRQDRLAAPGRADPHQPVDPIERRHDGRCIE